MSARMTPLPGRPRRDSEMDSQTRDAMISTTSDTEPQPSESSMQQDIARLAYSLWQRRGCPQGSAEMDWFEAEQELRESTERRESSVTRRF